MHRIRTLQENHFSRVTVLALTAVLVLVSPAMADDDKLEIHGFLSQAWGTTDFVEGPLIDRFGSPTQSEALLGIEEDGTFNYRTMALQFRYAITERDIMIVQLSHEVNGDSPVEQFRDEIELDWAFYERRFGADSRVKVGRVPIPFGIYNEIRDVGTILPFYRPAFAIYFEGAFTSETVDGLTLSHSFAADQSWNLDLDVYGGEFKSFEQGGPFTLVPLESDVLGLQLWLNTPVSGLRFGYSYQDRDDRGGIFRFPGQETGSEVKMGSVEGAFQKWSFRAEARNFDAFIPAGLFGPVRLDLELLSWYAQVGWRASELLQFYVQFEEQGTENRNSLLVGGKVDFDARQDLGIAINVAFSPQLVLKAEYHEVEVEGAVFRPIPTPQGLRLDPSILSGDDGSYTIVALSTSF